MPTQGTSSGNSGEAHIAQPLDGAPGPAAPPPAPRRESRAGYWILGIVVVGGAALGLTAANHLTGHPSTPSPSTTSTATRSAGSAPDGESRIAAWAADRGSGEISSLQSDFTAVQQAAGDTDLAALREACVSLRTDAAAAQAGAPIPDQTAQQHWAAGLADYTAAANACIAGVDDDSAAKISQATSKLNAGTNEIALASDRLGALQS